MSRLSLLVAGCFWAAAFLFCLYRELSPSVLVITGAAALWFFARYIVSVVKKRRGTENKPEGDTPPDYKNNRWFR